MKTIKNQMDLWGYTDKYFREFQRAGSVARAIEQQKDVFSHFATFTFPVAVTETDVAVAISAAFRTVDGYNQSRVKYFYEISLSPRHLFGSTTHSDCGDEQLLTRWHVHALLGGIRDSVTCEDLKRAFSRSISGRIDVQAIYDSQRLASYLTSQATGNFIGALQQTNMRSFREALAGFRVKI